MNKYWPIILSAALLTGCVQETLKPDIDESKEYYTPPFAFQDPAGDSFYNFEITQVSIDTRKGKKVNSKEDYIPCTVTVTPNSSVSTFQATGQIRGRGNSTWEWYPKKPYRLKLDESAAFLGLPKNRDWVFMADYRDVTHMMNLIGFALARCLDVPYANHTRYVRLELNGKDMGLYAVTEQVEEGGNRVMLDPDEGLLIALDVNDGPADCPGATNNFWSKVYGTACAVKYPKDAGADEVKYASKAFRELENAIASQDWERITSVLDVKSMAGYLLAQEIMGNVEMNNGSSIRSGYINRYSEDSKWVMGPIWDCDGGFSYDWSDMYDSRGWGHTYFGNYKYLVFGSDPYNRVGKYGSYPYWISDLFGVPEFVELIKEIWNDKKEKMQEYLLDLIDLATDSISSHAKQDLDIWSINNYSFKVQVLKMKNWLDNRFEYLNDVINNYP
ncbi:MAG: CotH kinase family protein [Bacteroidaceae bacterium]|nr:CotH kinase family protein [Bacteroidaceae bacterium]